MVIRAIVLIGVHRVALSWYISGRGRCSQITADIRTSTSHGGRQHNLSGNLTGKHRHRAVPFIGRFSYGTGTTAAGYHERRNRSGTRVYYNASCKEV